MDSRRALLCCLLTACSVTDRTERPLETLRPEQTAAPMVAAPSPTLTLETLSLPDIEIELPDLAPGDLVSPPPDLPSPLSFGAGVYGAFCIWKGPNCGAPYPPAAPLETATFAAGQTPPWLQMGWPDTQESVDDWYGQVCHACTPAYEAWRRSDMAVTDDAGSP